VKLSSHVIYCPECGKLQPEELSEPDEGGLSAAAVARSPQTEPQIPSPPVSPKTHAQNKVLKSEPVRVKVAPKPVSRMPVPAPQRATEPRRPSDEPDQILIVRDLSIVKGKKQIVQGIEFSVNRGEIVGILGPSGSGKSTIIKAITSESTGVAGQLIMGGFDLAREAQSAKEILGYVPQETQLYEDLSFGQNVMYFGSQYGLDKAYLAERAQKLAAVVDLGDRLNDKVGRLSGGQKKRVSVATALAHEPELVILDEPTSGLDPATRRSLWRFLKSVNQTYNVSMVVTTHFLDEGEYCDRLLIINKGRMVAYETPRTLKQSIPGAGKTIELEMFTLDDYVSAKLGEFESKVKQEGVADLVDRSGYKVKVFCKDISLAMAKIPILLGELGLGFKAMNVVDTSLEDVFIYFTGETFQEAS
jgi:ABC-2 type transport system ATP-binding protein